MLANAEESIVIPLDRALNAYRGLLEFIRIIETDALVNIVHATLTFCRKRVYFSFFFFSFTLRHSDDFNDTGLT